MGSEQERMKRMKKMSRVLGIDINQVAKVLEAQERAANGEIDEATLADVTGGGSSGNTSQGDDPFSKFMREQENRTGAESGLNGERDGSGDSAASTAADEKSLAPPCAEEAEPAKEEEMPPCVVLFSGGTDWAAVGRRSTEGDVMAPQRLVSFPKRIKCVASGPTACHSVCIDVDGGVYTWGRNESGCLGHGDTKTRSKPTLIDALRGTRVKQASCGKLHTALLTEDGVLYTMGGGKYGQLGIGRAVESCPEPKVVHVANGPVHKVSCGAEFTAIIDDKRRLLTFGSPQEGQLGGGTTGEFIEKAGKISYDLVLSPTAISIFVSKDARSKAVGELRGIELEDVACGKNHSVAVERAPRARIFTWGFGGYGRLGHACQASELRPRVVEGLARLAHVTVSKVSAGSGSSMAITTNGHLFYWGKLPNAPRGEATMYPKIVDDLSNWQVRSVTGSNGGIMVAAETSTIAWGMSVAGELGYGDGDSTPRTSTKPTLVGPLQGLTVMQVAMGYGHSLILTKDDKESAAKLKSFKECVPFEGKHDAEDEGESEHEEAMPKKKKTKTAAYEKPLKRPPAKKGSYSSKSSPASKGASGGAKGGAGSKGNESSGPKSGGKAKGKGKAKR